MFISNHCGCDASELDRLHTKRPNGAYVSLRTAWKQVHSLSLGFLWAAALRCWSTPSFLQYRDWPDSNFAFAFSTRIGKILAILRESSEWFPIFPRDAGIVQENLANLANLEAALTLRRVYQVFVALQEEQGLRPSGMAAHALLLMDALLAAARLSPVVTGTRSSR